MFGGLGSVTRRGRWAHAMGTIAIVAWCHVGWAAGLDPSSVLADLDTRAELVGPFPHRILRLDLDVTGDEVRRLGGRSPIGDSS
jgi:hypothetical protein